MDCRTARALVWPPERPRLAGGDVVRARTHVAECEACRTYLDQDRRLLSLYDRARREEAPIAVRERIFDTIAGARWDAARRGEAASPPRDHPEAGDEPPPPERRRGSSLVLQLLPLAAAATVVALTLVGREARPTSPEDPNVFVEDYLRRAVGADHIETEDPSEVRRFLERELGLSFDPISFAGLDLSRAEICLLEGRRGAMIVYKTDGAIVSHYLVPRQGAAARAPALSARDAGPGRDMPVVTWATDEVEQALVGEVGGDQLLAIAAAGVEPAPTSRGRPTGSS